MIEYIKEMNIMDKLRLGISVFSSEYINTSFNKKEMFEKMDKQLKKISMPFVDRQKRVSSGEKIIEIYSSA